MCVSLDDGAGDQAQGHRTCVQKVKGHLDDADKSADDKERCVFTLHVTGHVIYNPGYKFELMKICLCSLLLTKAAFIWLIVKNYEILLQLFSVWIYIKL